MTLSKRTNYLTISLVFFLLTGAILSSLFNYFPELVVFFLVGLTIACLLPGVFAWIKGSFDPFEPVYPVALATFVYFCLQVTVLIQKDSFTLLGIDYRAEVPKLTLLALVALLGFYVGYYRTDSPRMANLTNKDASRELINLAYARRWAIILFLFFGFLVVFWVVIGRIPLWTLWIFGEADYGSWWQEAAGVKLGYLYAARQALPACLLLLIATRSKPRWPVTLLFLLILLAVFLAGTGGRYRLLLIFGSTWVFYYLERDKRPSIWQLIFAGVLVFYFIIGFVGYYRGPNRVLGANGFNLISAWDTFEGSTRIAVSSAVFLRWIPGSTGYWWGRTFLRILIQPIPSFLWPDKHTFVAPLGLGLERFLNYGAAYPLWMEFYINFGVLGIVSGTVLAGWLCKNVYKDYRKDRYNLFCQLSLALLWPLLFHVYGRGNPALIFYQTLYIFAPVWIIQWLVKKREAKKLGKQDWNVARRTISKSCLVNRQMESEFATTTIYIEPGHNAVDRF